MSDWINLAAIWKIIVFSLIAGAGLPALFAIGMLALSRGPKVRAADADSEVLVGGSPAGIAVASLCFLIVLAAIVWGIYKVYQLGHPH
jgi:hypothetical protein